MFLFISFSSADSFLSQVVILDILDIIFGDSRCYFNFFFYQSVISFRLSIFRDFVVLFWLIWAIWNGSDTQSPCWFHLRGGGVSLAVTSQRLWLGWRDFFGMRTNYFLALAVPGWSSFPLSSPCCREEQPFPGGTFSCQNLPFWCCLVPTIPH